jgi:hypothetical protein
MGLDTDTVNGVYTASEGRTIDGLKEMWLHRHLILLLGPGDHE